MIEEQRLYDILKKYWGYDSFREMQKEVILSVLNGNDTLALMPTGGGKSICFQVPGLILGGLTIVVTPLISLMKDQVDNLRRHNIKAVYLHSGMSRREKVISTERLYNGKCNFLYISPERLQNSHFRFELSKLNVTLLVVDEAHCISQWGYDFRPSYLNINIVRKLFPTVPIMALTASATEKVASDICDKLLFRNHTILKKSFIRDNISYIVRATEDKDEQLARILCRTHGSSIVYVRSRKRTREVATFLNSIGISATYFHAGLDFEIKEQRQNDWMTGRVRVIVATNAFGMGIDKPNVRVVIHYAMPPSLEDYYQESGRAGRDGLNSYAVLLYSKKDSGVLRRHLTEEFPPKEEIRKIYERVCNFLSISLNEGYEQLYEFDLDKFCNTFNYKPTIVKSALRILGNSNYLEYIDEMATRSRIMITMRREELYDLEYISKEATDVLMALMRSYTGLFVDYTYISESKLALDTNISTEHVYNALLELSKNRVLHYIPLTRTPYIYISTSREEANLIQITRQAYELRKEQMKLRIEAMINFASEKTACRVNRMLAYFGEKREEDCGKCDICRDNNKKSNNQDIASLANAILQFIQISTRPISIHEVHAKFGDSQCVNDALRLLCLQEFVLFNQERYSINKKR